MVNRESDRRARAQAQKAERRERARLRSGVPVERSVTLTVELTDSQARVLAWTLAPNPDESRRYEVYNDDADALSEAWAELRDRLEDAGYAPR